MKLSKTLMASVVVLGTASAAQAQVKTDGLFEIYGRASFSVDQLDDGDQYNRMNLSSNASRLGFRGSKKIGDLTGIWQIEQEVQFNLSNDKGDTNNRLASRDTFAGIQGNFGTVRVGKFDTPFKVAREAFNLFGDQLGDMRNLTRVGGARFDERLNNMLEYQSPVMSGLQARIAYSFHSGNFANSASGVDKKEDATSLSLSYKSGDFDGSLAYESYGADNPLNSSGTIVYGKRDATRAALSYKLNPELRLVGFYQTAKSQSGAINDSGKVTGVGAEYMVSPKVALKAHYMNRNADAANKDATLYTLGVEYRYNKELRFYTSYASLDNDPSANLTPWKEGRTAAPAATSNGKTTTGLTLGMRYDF
ncbi:MAG: porin [Limnohabitans sp.]